MHMIVALVIDKAGFIIVFNDFRIGSVNNMTTIASKNAVVFKFVGGSGKGRLYRVSGDVKNQERI